MGTRTAGLLAMDYVRLVDSFYLPCFRGQDKHAPFQIIHLGRYRIVWEAGS